MSTPDPQPSQRIEHSSIQGSKIQQGQAAKNLTQIQADKLTQVYISLFERDRRTNDEKLRLDLAEQLLKNHIQPELKGRLRNTVYQDIWLNPDLEEQPYQVGSLLPSRLVKVSGKSEETLDIQTAILEVFVRPDIHGKLLILGEPGIGKTTTLLTLADQLVEQAIAHPGTAIPVIFELSAWKDNAQGIEEWLIQQLTKMRVSARIAKGWLKKELLILLLDGLDELEPTRQAICVQRLNQFAEHYPYLVVCCRAEEYEAGLKLNELRSAVRLQPLTPTQIQGYLQKVGRQTLWEAVSTHTEKQVFLHPDTEGKPGILQIPLFLKIAAEVGKPLTDKDDLFEAYVNKRLCHKVKNWERNRFRNKKWAYKKNDKEPTSKVAKHYLKWLAYKLKINSQSWFLLEEIQPKWLDTRKQRNLYRLSYGLFAGAFGLFFGFFNGFLGVFSGAYPIKTLSKSFISRFIIGLIFGFFLGVYGGLSFGFLGILIGLWHGLNDIRLVEALRLPRNWSKLRSYIHFILMLTFGGVILGLFCGLLFGFMGGVIGLFRGFLSDVSQPLFNLALKSSFSGFLFGIVIGLPYSVFFLFLTGVLEGLQTKVERQKRPNERIQRSLQNMVVSTILISPIFVGLLAFLYATGETANNLYEALTLSIYPGVISALLASYFMAGGEAVVRHFCLRFVLAYSKLAPYDYVTFLDYCVERRLLRRVGGRYQFLHRELQEYFAGQAGGIL
jgi:MFS family permease